MDYKDIETLLDKYWACETSLEEEDRLKVFFSSGDVPEHLNSNTSMFQYYQKMGEEWKGEMMGKCNYQKMRMKRTGDDFDKKILDRLENRGDEGEKHRFMSHLYKVAAAVLLVLSVIFIHEQYTRVKKEATSFANDTFEDPDAALKEARRVLLLVSSKMNRGTETLAKVNEFNKVEEILDKSKTQ